MTLHFASPKLHDERGRLAALYRYEILDTDPETEFEEIIRLVKCVFDVPIAAISLMAEERQWFKAAAGLGMAETPRSVALCHHTIQGVAPFVVHNAAEHPLFAANPLVTGAPGIRGYLGVPLTTPEGYNVGSLCLIGTEPRNFSEADAAVLGNFARLVISQLELRMLARRDSLTGALSRGAFEAAAREAAESWAEEPCDGALLLFDLDHFKFVNDRFGHCAGDLVLKAVAEAISTEAREEDRVGRLGGEEFALLVRRGGTEAACAMAERIRAKVAGLSLPDLDGHRITISAGVAPWRREQASLEAWAAAADVALYAAKRAGRDQVMLAA